MYCKQVFLIFIIIGIVVLSGCTPGTVPQLTPTPEPLTITFAFPESPDRERYQRLADEFQELYPHITLDLKSSAMMELPRDPQNSIDAFVWWPDPSLTEVNPVVEKIDAQFAATFKNDDFYPPALEMFRWHGAAWAVPAELDMQLLYYNKALFDAQGADYPEAGWTWDDLLSTAQQLTIIEQPAYNAAGYGLATNPRWGDFVPFIYQHGGDLFDFENPHTAEAIQWYVDLTAVHGVSPLPKHTRFGDIYAIFSVQKAAMWIGFFADRAGMGYHHMSVPWDFEWGVVPLPSDESAASLYRGQGYYVTNYSAHAEEAWLWIRFLTTHPAGKGFPAYRTTAESNAFRELVGDSVSNAGLRAVEHLVPRANTSGVPPETLEIYARTVESVVNDGLRVGFYTAPEIPRAYAVSIEAVISGELTVEEALEKLRQQYEQ